MLFRPLTRASSISGDNRRAGRPRNYSIPGTHLSAHPKRPKKLWGPSTLLLNWHRRSSQWKITGATPPPPTHIRLHNAQRDNFMFLAIFSLKVPVNIHSAATDEFLCFFLQSRQRTRIHDVYFRGRHWTEKFYSGIATFVCLINLGNRMKPPSPLIFVNVIFIVHTDKRYNNINTRTLSFNIAQILHTAKSSLKSRKSLCLLGQCFPNFFPRGTPAYEN